jgi:hypothetical protein
MSFTGPMSDTEEALRRMGPWMLRQKGGGS